jgi:predicted phosphodiesterase
MKKILLTFICLLLAAATIILAYIQFSSPNSEVSGFFTQLKNPRIVRQSQQNKTKIAAVGDISCSSTSPFVSGYDTKNCQSNQVRDLINREGANDILALGDLQYESGTLAEFKTSFSQFDTFGTRLKPVPGNHEYGTVDAAGYFGYFGSRAGINKKGWYSYNINNWHIIALNSNCDKVGCVIGSEQYNWLQNDLNSNTNACTIAFWHHPRYSSGTTHGDNVWHQDMWKLMADKRVDIVLAGHEHNYERFNPIDGNGNTSTTGIRSFVVGNGGKSLYSVKTTPREGSAYLYNGNFGALFLTLENNSYSWDFRTINSASIDYGSGSCV